MAVSTKESIFQSPLHPQTLYTKLSQHLSAFLGVHDFRMELRCIKFLFRTFHGCNRTNRRIRHSAESFGNRCDIVGMAHPADRLRRNSFEENRCTVGSDESFAVFADGSRFHGSSQHVCHELGAVTDSQNRNSQFKYFGFTLRRCVVVDTVGTAGEDDARRLYFPDLFHRFRMRNDFRKNSCTL